MLRGQSLGRYRCSSARKPCKRAPASAAYAWKRGVAVFFFSARAPPVHLSSRALPLFFSSRSMSRGERSVGSAGPVRCPGGAHAGP
eukprot:10534661-Alexandrium_andersonii.AAC.1